jgi:hypothetical protein
MRNLARPPSAILGAIFICATVAGCAALMGPQKRVATPAELEQLGSRTYPGYTKDQVTQATMTALKVQGYEVVTTEPRIRTSPKLVHVSASSSYTETSGSSQSFAESVAWDIDVIEGQEGTSVHAVPRASVNGIPMEQMYYDYATRTFGELMKDIDASLPAKKPASAGARPSSI